MANTVSGSSQILGGLDPSLGLDYSYDSEALRSWFGEPIGVSVWHRFPQRSEIVVGMRLFLFALTAMATVRCDAFVLLLAKSETDSARLLNYAAQLTEGQTKTLAEAA